MSNSKTTLYLIFCAILKISLSALIIRASSLVYTPSDAYEESILRPFRSYSDVAIFHFSVPQETKRAMWQFVAFMDDPSCVPRTVHIFLRHGSYPVVSPDNGSYPEEVVVPRNHLYTIKTVTNYQPKEMPEFHIMNPIPGSWFGIAYIPDWNKEIKVQGISHNCHYSLGSMAAWTIEPKIQLLSPGSSFEVYASSQINYFKIFILENTWSFQLSITNCSFKNTSTQEFVSIDASACVQQFGIRAKGLPFSSPINNINGSSQFTHFISQPQTNSYYYLLVISEQHAAYNIKATFQGCSDSWHQLVNKHVSQPVKHIYLKEWWSGLSRKFANGSRPAKRELEDDFNQSGEATSSWKSEEDCIPVISLTRVKHAQDFLDSFLLQGRDWFSSWLSVSEAFPLLVKFELLPFVDIGGTLQTRIHLDPIAQNLTTEIVEVVMCVSHEVPPSFVLGKANCSEEYSMKISSNKNLAIVKYFPFPKPGTWFISFEVTCYNSTGNQSQSCEMEQVMVDLAIRLQPCVFEGQPCGTRGLCRENHFRQFYFSSCQCIAGYKGWACTDGSNSVSSSVELMKTLLLTLSNAFFIPAVFLAIRRKYYTEAIVYGVTMFFSTFYHACDVERFSFCLLKYEVLQFCDFYSAILSVWVTLVAIAGLSHMVTSIAHMSGALGIALGVEYQRTGFWVFVIPFLIGLIILILSWGCRCYQEKSLKMFQIRSLVRLLLGSLTAITGLILFAFVETEENYKYIHSTWHIIIAISIAFLLPTKKNKSGFGQLNNNVVSTSIIDQPVFFHSPLNNDSEMLDISEYRVNSDSNMLINGN